MKLVHLLEFFRKRSGHRVKFRGRHSEKLLLTIAVFFLVFFAGILSPKLSNAQVQVVTHPEDLSICSGDGGTFSVVASNASSWQWQENDGVSWSDLDNSVTYVSGIYSATLEISDANTGLNGYSYRCRMSSSAGDIVYCDPAVLSVNNPPVFNDQPIDTRACRNSWVNFHVGVESPATSYRWQENNGTGWVDLVDNSFCAGATTADLSMYVTTGMNGHHYRCVVFNGGCPKSSNSGALFVDPIPVSYSVIGGGLMCENSEGLEVALDGSEMGINYELFLEEVAVGNVVAGTGSVINFGPQKGAGNYKVKATNTSTGCFKWMNGKALIIHELMPIAYDVIGGGHVCKGSEGVEIKLNGSEINTSYTLVINDKASAVTVEGTGNPISFGVFDQAGIYKVEAEKSTVGCSATMNGQAEIVVHELPVAVAGEDQIIEEGTYCQLNASATGGSGVYSYHWVPSNLLEEYADPQLPSTVPLYNTTMFLLNVKDINTSCLSLQDTTIITVKDTELTAFINANPQLICQGDVVSLVGLGSGGNGSYTYKWTSSPEGEYENESSILVSPSETTSYYLEVSDGVNVATADIVVTVRPLPQLFDVVGGGNYCSSEDGSHIYLSNSEKEVIYELRNKTGALTRLLYGTGEELDFGVISAQSEYEVFARREGMDCEMKMNGKVEVKRYETPTVIAGDDIIIDKDDQVHLFAEGYGGSGDYLYEWKPEDKLESSDVHNPLTKTLQKTEAFEVIVRDAESNCPSLPDHQVVFVKDNSDLTLDVNAQFIDVCPNQEFKVFALASGGSGDYACLWESRPKGFGSDEFSPIAQITENTWFIVKVSDGLQTKKDSVFVKVKPIPEVFSITGGGSYCPINKGVEVGLDGSADNIWYTLMMNNESTGQTVKGNGNAVSFGKQGMEGMYTIIASPNKGCSTTMDGNVSVEIKDEPKKFELFGGGVWCKNDIGVGVLLKESEKGVSYELMNEAELSGIVLEGTGLPLQFKEINNAGNYSILATHTETGCEALMTNLVHVGLKPVPDLLVIEDPSICKGEEVELYVSGADSYSWGVTPPVESDKIIVQPEESTTYLVKGVGNNGCSATKSITVNVNELPEIDYFLDKNQKKIILSPINQGIYSFFHEDQLLYKGDVPEYYLGNMLGRIDQVKVQMTTEAGCSSDVLVKIGLMKDVNAFSPNGDGVNDIFMRGAYIIVFDKWGVKMYEGEDGWNGTFDKREVAPGTYYFIEKIFDQTSTLVKTRKGSVTLIRN